MSKKEHEIEKKIMVSADDLKRLFDEWSPQALDGKIKKKHRPRAYFDSKSRRLQRHDIALRIQYKEDAGYEQTIKHGVKTDEKSAIDALSRCEIKDFLKGKSDQPDLSLIDLDDIDDADIRKTLKKCQDKKLKHVFTAAVKRKYFVVAVEKDGEVLGKVELAFDEGQVIHADEIDLSEDVSEIEVELKEGDPSVVDIVCDRILEQAPNAYVSTKSKADTGYALDVRAQERKDKRKEVEKNVARDKKDLPKKSGRMFPF